MSVSALERAHTYASIFLGAGDGWRGYVPVDATTGEGDVIHLQGIRMARGNDCWVLETNDKRYVVRPKAEPDQTIRYRPGHP